MRRTVVKVEAFFCTYIVQDLEVSDAVKKGFWLFLYNLRRTARCPPCLFDLLPPWSAVHSCSHLFRMYRQLSQGHTQHTSRSQPYRRWTAPEPGSCTRCCGPPTTSRVFLVRLHCHPWRGGGEYRTAANPATAGRVKSLPICFFGCRGPDWCRSGLLVMQISLRINYLQSPYFEADGGWCVHTSKCVERAAHRVSYEIKLPTFGFPVLYSIKSSGGRVECVVFAWGM